MAQVTQPHLLGCRFANLGCEAKFRQPLGLLTLDQPSARKDVVGDPRIMEIFDEMPQVQQRHFPLFAAEAIMISPETNGAIIIADAESESGDSFTVTKPAQQPI